MSFEASLKMFDLESAKYLRFYASAFIKANREGTQAVYDLDLKTKIPLMTILCLETIKNFVLFLTPMSNARRYIVWVLFRQLRTFKRF